MPNDDIQAAHVEWQRTQFEREKLAWEWLQRHMPAECEAALAKFVEVNPHQRGIQWWDVLSIMSDADGHLDIIEPMADEMDDWQSPLYTFVAYTLLYASKAFATDYTVAQRVHSVQASIRNERFIEVV